MLKVGVEYVQFYGSLALIACFSRYKREGGKFWYCAIISDLLKMKIEITKN